MDGLNKKPSFRPTHKPAVNEYNRILNELKAQTSQISSSNHKTNFFPQHQKPETLNEKIRKQKIENDNNEKDQNLKRLTLIVLFIFLGIETAAVFTLAFFQGFKMNGFNMDAWSFRILLVATLGQITAMLTIAVRHLFPTKH